MSRFTIADAVHQIAILERPFARSDIENDTAAFREHWRAVGALKIIIKDLQQSTKEQEVRL